MTDPQGTKTFYKNYRRTTMNDLRTAAQQALKAMEDRDYRRLNESIDALRAALAQQAESVQEPVAWMVYTLDGKSVCVTDNPADFGEGRRALPLYTAPPQRKPLTEEEIEVLRAALAQEQVKPQSTPATPAWWRDGLTATLMREGVNKHRAREIADGYWEAYCEIGGHDD